MSIEDALLTAIGQERGGAAADRLCQACVALLGVDAAAISLVFDGVNVATLGASSPAARIYDELQLTLGEGPGLDAVAYHSPVLIDDLTDSPNGEPCWLLYNQTLLSHHIQGVHAVPIMMADNSIGALSVFHDRLPNWTVEHFDGVAVAAELASLRIVDLYSGDLDAGHVEPGNDTWTRLNPLTRSDVNHATGMVMSQLDVTAPTALARLRAHAFATNRSPTSVARDIIDRRIRMEPH